MSRKIIALLTLTIGAALFAIATSAHAADWGTLKGRFIYDGPKPTPAALTINKDPEVCGQKPLFDESMVVGADGGLANVAVWARDKKIKVHPDYAASDDAKIELNNLNCHFVPHMLGIRVGQTLVIKNSDKVPHSTKIDGQALQINPTIAVGQSSEQVIDSAEPLLANVSCAFHNWMAAKLVVRPNPYFAISDKDGRFEIKNLPAGEHEFQVIHDSGYVQKALIGGSDAAWEKGRVKWTIEPGKTTDLGDIKLTPNDGQFK